MRNENEYSTVLHLEIKSFHLPNNKEDPLQFRRWQSLMQLVCSHVSRREVSKSELHKSTKFSRFCKAFKSVIGLFENQRQFLILYHSWHVDLYCIKIKYLSMIYEPFGMLLNYTFRGCFDFLSNMSMMAVRWLRYQFPILNILYPGNVIIQKS